MLYSKRVLCLHSLPTTGVAGLKVIQSTLGQYCCPLPTVLLSGVGSDPLCQRSTVALERLLESAEQVLKREERPVALFVGYLDGVDQANFLRDWIKAHRDHFERIYVDPICGDRGRLYVDEGMPIAWRGLIKLADVTMPNPTELELITGDATDPETAWRERFPTMRTIVTSAEEEGQYGIKLLGPKRNRFFPHSRLPVAFSGTGELFAANFILRHSIEEQDGEQAIEGALDATLRVIERSVATGARELLLLPDRIPRATAAGML